MSEEIERALSVLEGLPLWDAGRVVNLEWFQFGDRRVVPDWHEGTKLVGAYALHAQCMWRITGPTSILVAANDRYLAAGDDPFQDYEAFDRDRPGANRCDERIRAFFDARRAALPVVGEVQADPYGGVRLTLIGGFRLEIFPDNSSEGEHWRLFQPGTTREHFVVTGAGIERH